MEYIFMLIFGICIIILGVLNYKGNISSIHWYNRTRITKENSKKYGEAMGLGTIIIGIIIGVSLTITAILQMIFDIESLWLITLVGVIVGLVFLLYGQFKYNRGIF